MKETNPPKKDSEEQKPASSNDHTGTDTDSDHSGKDGSNDQTETLIKPESDNKFDKPKREVDPDTTGIDIESDKTKNSKQ